MVLVMFLIKERIFQDLTARATLSVRSRDSLNIHSSFQEPCQRLLNAINIGSYIQPHRHCLDPKKELLIAVKGKFAAIEFSDSGFFKGFSVFGSEKYCDSCDSSYGVEVPPSCWHTVIALEPGSVLLEVKEGPFDIRLAKEIAPWAPEVGSDSVNDYIKRLYEYCNTD